MHTRQRRFAAAIFHRLEDEHDTQHAPAPDPARHESDVWAASRPLVHSHPIDEVDLAFLEGPHIALAGREGINGKFVLAAVSPRGHRTADEIQFEAGLLLRLPGLWEAATAGVLAGDSFGGVFHQSGEDLLPLRVGWSMEGAAVAPKLTTIHAEVHPHVQDELALQFIREEGEPPREGSLFAPPNAEAFAGVKSVTFGVPWLSPHQELVLTVPLAGFVTAAYRFVRELRERMRW